VEKRKADVVSCLVRRGGEGEKKKKNQEEMSAAAGEKWKRNIYKEQSKEHG
jgi:hypothetical protein